MLVGNIGDSNEDGDDGQAEGGDVDGHTDGLTLGELGLSDVTEHERDETSKGELEEVVDDECVDDGVSIVGGGANVSCVVCSESCSSLLNCNSAGSQSVVDGEDDAVQSNEDDNDGEEVSDGESLSTELEGVEEEQVDAEVLGDECADGDGSSKTWQPDLREASGHRWVEGPHDDSNVDQDASKDHHEEEERTSGLDFAVVAEDDDHDGEGHGDGKEDSRSNDDSNASARGERMVDERDIVVSLVRDIGVKQAVEASQVRKATGCSVECELGQPGSARVDVGGVGLFEELESALQDCPLSRVHQVRWCVGGLSSIQEARQDVLLHDGTVESGSVSGETGSPVADETNTHKLTIQLAEGVSRHTNSKQSRVHGVDGDCQIILLSCQGTNADGVDEMVGGSVGTIHGDESASEHGVDLGVVVGVHDTAVESIDTLHGALLETRMDESDLVVLADCSSEDADGKPELGVEPAEAGKVGPDVVGAGVLDECAVLVGISKDLHGISVGECATDDDSVVLLDELGAHCNGRHVVKDVGDPESA